MEYFIYPGAVLSRFEHSLGMMGLASQFSIALFSTTAMKPRRRL